MPQDETAKLPTPQYVGWDCGAGAIRIANIDTRYRPEPALITSQMDDRHFLSMTCMRLPQAFHRSTLFNTPNHIIMDAFRCQPTQSDYLFCVPRKNEKYEITPKRRIMKNNVQPKDYEDYKISGTEPAYYKHEEIMTTIIQEVSKAFSLRNICQNGAYICVPDAAPLEYIRKLRRAFIEVFKKRHTTYKGEKILSSDNIFFIQRTAAAVQMYFHRRSGIKVYEHNREQFHREERNIPPNPVILPRTVVVIAFGAGHFSSAIYKQETFERYGIRHIFNQSNDALGGEDLCNRLVEYAIKQKLETEEEREAFKKNKRLLKFLRNAMDQAKIDLSGFTPAIVDVEMTDDNIETMEITRDQFENVIAKTEFDLIETYIQALKQETQKLKLDVTDVLLVRGSTRTKKILDLVATHFPGANYEGTQVPVPIVKCLNTDECIVMGTALKGALRSGIHRTAYAEVEDVAMRDEWVEIDGIKLFLTKKHESVQNSKEHWIKASAGKKIIYNEKSLGMTKIFWKRDVACDPKIMIKDFSYKRVSSNPALRRASAEVTKNSPAPVKRGSSKN